MDNFGAESLLASNASARSRLLSLGPRPLFCKSEGAARRWKGPFALRTKMDKLHQVTYLPVFRVTVLAKYRKFLGFSESSA